MSTKTQAAAIAGLVAFAALLYWIEQPFRTTTPPDPDRIEEMLGRDPGDPSHQYVSSALIYWRRAKLSLETGLPVFSGDVAPLTGDFWTYRFPADATYRPPSHPLDCNIDSGVADAVLYCRHVVRKAEKSWTYTLSRLADEDSAVFVVRASSASVK